MRYRVRHTTLYAYSDSVDLATHMLHLQPRADLVGQSVVECGISVSPSPAARTEAIDHFGNCVSRIVINTPHKRFEVITEAVVDVAFPPPPEPSTTLPWEQVVAAAAAGGESSAASEFLFESPLVPAVPAAGAYAEISFAPGRPILDALIDLNSRIRRDFTFRASVTGIGTPISRVLARREGVCQDFSHLMIAGLRGLGVPARYVSGYIRTKPPPGAPKMRGVDQSHAWVSAWLGPRDGWVGLDPTNGLIVADEHVMLGWGRDYHDVSPVRGVILGGGRHTLSVEVDLAPA